MPRSCRQARAKATRLVPSSVPKYPREFRGQTAPGGSRPFRGRGSAMTDKPSRPPARPRSAAPKPARRPAEAAAPKSAEAGERIAKVLSRAGISSRREAERLIALGQVSVNGKVIDSPALNVTAKDRILVAGEPLAPPEPARLWLYYKPEGLVTSAADEKGRETVFDHLPPDLPRVMSVGRLDLNSEGLLLLTNDGELKRRLELPSTGWLRKYRVRVKGNPVDPDLEPLRQGITVEGERFQPMTVTLDRVQGANAWLTVGLREGRNREIRRAMAAIGLTVNRLIRVSYGPFRLNEMQPGDVEEVRGKVLRDQLGLEAPDPAAQRARPAPRATATAPGKAPGASAAKAATKAATGTRAPGRGKSAAAPGPKPMATPARGGTRAATAPAGPVKAARRAASQMDSADPAGPLRAPRKAPSKPGTRPAKPQPTRNAGPRGSAPAGRSPGGPKGGGPRPTSGKKPPSGKR